MLVVLDRVVRLSGHDEIGGDELGALVEELVKGVLRVGRGLAEEDWASGVLDVVAGAGDGLAVGLHGELLEVGGEAVEVLVEGRDKVSLRAEEVAVPDGEKTTNDGNVLFERSFSEVLVHRVSTGKELVEVVKADVKSNRQTDSAPDGVTATDPGLETEHVLAVNAELGDLLDVGRQSDEVLGNVSIFLRSLQEPLLSSVGVGSRLSGGEGLGGDQEERGLGVGLLEGLSDMSAVNVGDEVELEVGVSVRLEGFGDHDRAATKHVSCDPKQPARARETHRSEPPIPTLMIVLIFLPV